MAAHPQARSASLAQLPASHGAFFEALAAAPALLRAASSAGRWLFFNERWLAFTGCSAEDSLGERWLESVHPQDRARCVRHYDRAFERRSALSLDYRLRRADGVWRCLHEEAAPYFAADGSLAGFVAAASDVTELKETREALERNAMGQVAQARKFALRLIDVQE